MCYFVCETVRHVSFTVLCNIMLINELMNAKNAIHLKKKGPRN